MAVRHGRGAWPPDRRCRLDCAGRHVQSASTKCSSALSKTTLAPRGSTIRRKEKVERINAAFVHRYPRTNVRRHLCQRVSLQMTVAVCTRTTSQKLCEIARTSAETAPELRSRLLASFL